MEEPSGPEEAFVLRGVGIPVPREESDRAEEEMARCFIEEYVRMGYGTQAMVELCRNPFYRGLHAVWRSRGERTVRRMIEEALRQWRPHTCEGDSSDAEGL